MPPTADELDKLLARTDPLSLTALQTPSILAALDELSRQVVQSRPIDGGSRARPPRRLSRRFMTGGVASLLVVSVASAVTLLTARTGEHLPPRYATAGGPGELLRTWAPDFCRVVLADTSNIHFAPNSERWRLRVLTFENDIAHPTRTGNCSVALPVAVSGHPRYEVTVGAERGSFAMSAFCSWVNDYRDAEHSGNVAEAARASRAVANANSWPAVRAEQTRLTRYSVFSFFAPFQRAVASQNKTQLSVLWHRPQNACTPFEPTR